MRDLGNVEASTCDGFRLRRLFAGELPDGAAATLRAHVDTCDRCTEAWAELQRETAAFREAMPYEDFEAGVKRRFARTRAEAATAVVPMRRTMPRWIARTVPLAAAASLALVAGVSLLRPASVPYTGIKGSAVELIVGGTSAQRDAVDGEQLGAGERVRVLVKPAADERWGLVLSVDDAGMVTPLYDLNGKSLPLTQGPQVLPESLEFDGRGAERVYVLLSHDPLSTEEVAASARSEFTRAGSVERMGSLPIGAAEQDTRLLRKP